MDAGQYTMGTNYANPASSDAKAQYGNYVPGLGELGSSCTPGSSSYDDLVADCQSGRHFGGVNMAFADGHVKWLKTAVVSAEAKKPTPNRYGAWDPANS
jgi:prepilin-type processing-associated H-X9-DG protein